MAGGEAVIVVLFVVVDADVVAPAIIVVFAASHAERFVARKFNAHRLGGAVAGATVLDGAKTVFHGPITESAGGTIGAIGAGVADLRFAADESADSDDQGDQQRRSRRKGTEEMGSGMLLSHRVNASADEKTEIFGAVRSEEHRRRMTPTGLYRRVEVMTR